MLPIKNGLNCLAFLNNWSAQNPATTTIQSWREEEKPGGTNRILITQLSARGNPGEDKETLAISTETGASPIHTICIYSSWKIKVFFFNWGAHSKHCKYPSPAWSSMCFRLLRLPDHSLWVPTHWPSLRNYLRGGTDSISRSAMHSEKNS